MVGTNKWLWRGVVVMVIVLGLSMWVWAQSGTNNTMKNTVKKEATDMAKDQMKSMMGTKEMTCPMKSKASCMSCIKVCQENKDQVGEAIASLDAATTALNSGDTTTAKMELHKAKTLLAAVDKRIDNCMAQMPACNAKCPISGRAVDPKAPTRMFKGMKIGFCCGNCPLAWDKLSDAQKQAKLTATMPAGKCCPMMSPSNPLK